MGALFARWKEAVNLHDRPTLPRGFVLRLAKELAPAHVCDALGEMVVALHILHLQAFERQDLVFVHKTRRQLMQEVLAFIGHVSMETSRLLARLFAVLGTLLLASESSLRLREPLLISVEEVGIAYFLNGRRCRGVLGQYPPR